MIKIRNFLATFLFSVCFVAYAQADSKNSALSANSTNVSTTKSDAVIFKIHDITPVADNGIVTGCDFILTLYNRTPVNFRSFTINLNWNDTVEDGFAFDKYVETVIGKEEALKQKEFLKDKTSSAPVKKDITVNAFGIDKQVSIKSHIDTEKCYLLLTKADYKVTPCDIVRSTDSAMISGSNNDCSSLFQLVDTGNPEYYGKFKNIPATDLAMSRREAEKRELSDIDMVISKIVENLGTSGNALADIN